VAQGLTAVAEELHRARDETLVGDTRPRPRPVQVMNLHQTKGGEADTTILLLAGDEYYGPEASRSSTARDCSTSS
jgi:DNA helicase-2/ATP-dependent DNA helicase PcrA